MHGECSLFYTEDVIYVILCIEKRTLSIMCGEHCLSFEQRKRLPSFVYTIVVIYSWYTSTILAHSLLCTEMEYVILCVEKRHALFSAQRWSMSSSCVLYIVDTYDYRLFLCTEGRLCSLHRGCTVCSIVLGNRLSLYKGESVSVY